MVVGCIFLVALALACTAAAAGAARATASKCAQAVVDDWSRDGLDHTYAAHCYREALAALPEDIRIYSSAPDDIGQALAARVARPAQAVRKVAAVRRTRSASSAGAEGSAGVPTPVLLAGSLALVLVMFSSAGAVLYRRLHR